MLHWMAGTYLMEFQIIQVGLYNNLTHFYNLSLIIIFLVAYGTPITSCSNSRRNSVGSTLKCDNVTKYPDRKQIEDKLTQIREYLEVTSSLMTSIRNSEEQVNIT